MANSGFKTPISISDAIEYIEQRKFLLPAIQRKFVWSSEQIEVLFDSIMRDYPINSFMIMLQVVKPKTTTSFMSSSKNIELFLKMKTHTYLQKATLTLWLL